MPITRFDASVICVITPGVRREVRLESAWYVYNYLFGTPIQVTREGSFLRALRVIFELEEDPEIRLAFASNLIQRQYFEKEFNLEVARYILERTQRGSPAYDNACLRYTDLDSTSEFGLSLIYYLYETSTVEPFPESIQQAPVAEEPTPEEPVAPEKPEDNPRISRYVRSPVI